MPLQLLTGIKLSQKMLGSHRPHVERTGSHCSDWGKRVCRHFEIVESSNGKIGWNADIHMLSLNESALSKKIVAANHCCNLWGALQKGPQACSNCRNLTPSLNNSIQRELQSRLMNCLSGASKSGRRPIIAFCVLIRMPMCLWPRSSRWDTTSFIALALSKPIV